MNSNSKSLENQLVELQNQLIEQTVDKVKNKIRFDEMLERSDFYENLHNKEQKDLYEMQEKNKCLLDQIKSLNKELEKAHNESVYNAGRKLLFKMLIKKIIRR